jgi:Flp pilus assembly protein TadB
MRGSDTRDEGNADVARAATLMWLALFAALGLVLLIESLRQGLYTLPVVAVIGTAVWYLHVWWTRRAERRQR